MIRQAVLSNGIRVVVESVPEARKVALRFAFNVGSQNDPRELSGLAHFTEHALFLGTQTYTDKEIQNIERKSGATFNAETNQDNIYLFTDVLPEDVSVALQVFSDMIQHPVFSEKLIQQEKNIILTELKEVQDDIEMFADNLIYNAAFKRTPLGLPTEGTVKTVRAITRADIVRFHQEYFRPENLVISVAGDVEAEKFIQECRTLFKDFHNDIPEPALVSSQYLGGDRREEAETEINTFRMGFESIPLQDFRQFVIAEVYASVMEDRLLNALRMDKGLLYEIHADNFMYRQASLFCISWSCESEKNADITQEICQTVSQSTTNITEAELETVKKRIKLDFGANDGTLSEKAESNQFDIHSFGQIKNVNNLYEVLESITPDDIAQMAYRITSSRLSFAGVGNIRKMPSYEQINKWLSKSKEKRENELFQQKERQIVMKMSDKNQRIR